VAKKVSPLLPATQELLRRFGERLRLARLRRRLTALQVAERAGMVPMTLRSLERGGPGVTIGAYLAVMQVLGIERELEQLAALDPLGRQLQDAHLPQHGRAAASPSRERRERAQSVALQPKPSSKNERKPRTGPKPDPNWAEQGEFASARQLAALIEPASSARKKKR
jgi:transcriptional regulator with XRE-family HTH domain